MSQSAETLNFSWPSYPSSQEEFDSLMVAVDTELARRGLKPFQRPLHLGRLFWEAFGWGGLLFPDKNLIESLKFDGNALMAKAHDWYERNYGEKLKADFAYGFLPVRLGNALWRVRFGLTYGTVNLFVDRDLKHVGRTLGKGRAEPANFNVLCAVGALPQALASRLTDREAIDFFRYYVIAARTLQWRDGLPNLELFNTARDDLESSTADVLGGRYGQARWGAQQAVEKTIKGLLELAGTKYPDRGPKGHDLLHLGDLLNKHHSIALDVTLLQLASCSPAVRYGKEPSSEQQSLDANHAALGILAQISSSAQAAEILRMAADQHVARE